MFKIATQNNTNEPPAHHQRVTAPPESQGVTMEPSGRAGDARDWGFLETLGARADIAVPGISVARTYPALGLPPKKRCVLVA